VLLVRLGGFAAGVFEGSRLTVSKVGSRPVHGRSAAGGWSQKRFARRREAQAHDLIEAAVGVAVRVLLPAIATLDAVVLGGDRRTVEAVAGDPRLAALRPLVSGPILDVPDPGKRVLESAPDLFCAVRIRVVER
jgi:peptide subunit release factor 1 (eRF1)